MTPLQSDTTFTGRTYHITDAPLRSQAYEGHLFHDAVQLKSVAGPVTAQTGDYYIELDQPACRYLVEALEPEAHDSFFRWGFFNSILEKKERFSAYLFEDTAAEMLLAEPELQRLFAQWKLDHPQLLADQSAVLDFLFASGQRHQEPGWMRYPVMAVMERVV